MGRAHARLDRAEGMFDRLAPRAHGLRILVEPLLHSLDHMLVFPPCDPSLLAGCAVVFDGAALADIGPIVAQLQPVFDIGVMVPEPFSGWATIDVLLRQIDEVLL